MIAPPEGMTIWDALAFALALTLWQGATWWVEYGPSADQSMSAVISRHRVRWMQIFKTRSLRVVDVTILTNLQTGTAFFASTALLGVGGAVTMIAQADTLKEVAADLPLVISVSRAAWELKLLFVLWLSAYAFLKFAWAHRLFGYNAVLLGAIPHLESGDDRALTDEEAAERDDLCLRAARLNTFAARSFNRGLRGIYFALGAMGWMVGPAGLAIGVLIVAQMIHRREFRSDSRAAAMGADGGSDD